MRSVVHSRRGGFTLVEMLVVIGILILLTSLVAYAVQSTRGGDKAKSSGRTAQSAFLGARDRAIHAKESRGIRLLRDATIPDSANPGFNHIVVGFEYLRPLPSLTCGKQPGASEVQLERLAPGGEVARVIAFGSDQAAGSSTGWRTLRDKGLFSNLSRIRIPAGSTGRWFPINAVLDGPNNQSAEIRIIDFGDYDPGYAAPNPIAVPSTSDRATCDIELGNETLPFSQTITMASGIVIDLNWSSVAGLTPAQLSDVNRPLEFMFSPRGVVTGSVSALGPMHFLISDLSDALSRDPTDATKPLSPIHPRNRGEKMVLTVFPLTGNVTVSPIDPTDADNDGIADNLFRFAKQGGN